MTGSSGGLTDPGADLLVHPTVILDYASQVLKVGDHFNRLCSWHEVDGHRTQCVWAVGCKDCKCLCLLTADCEAHLLAASR